MVIRDGSRGDSEAVTGLVVADLDQGILLFVLTAKSLVSYVIRNRTIERQVEREKTPFPYSSHSQQTVHDAKGATRDCWCFSPVHSQLTLANSDVRDDSTSAIADAMQLADGVLLRRA